MVNDLDKIITICSEYKDVFSSQHFSYGDTPYDIIEACAKLKALGFAWGDPLPNGDFRISKKYYLTNSATHFQPKENTYYIEWDNGNIGRFQFVNSGYSYYDDIEDEWNEFMSRMMSYNPVDYDPFNCHIIYDVENGKRVMTDYEDICAEIRKKITEKIRLIEIERKKAELERLISGQKK